MMKKWGIPDYMFDLEKEAERVQQQLVEKRESDKIMMGNDMPNNLIDVC